MTDCSSCKSVIRGETGIRCNGVCDKVYHSTKKCSGIDQYSIGVLESSNFVRFICEDCMQYIRNVDLVLGEIQDGVRVNKQNLKEYKREFETSLKQNENEIKELLEAIEKRYEERLRILDKTQQECEKNVNEVKKLYGAVKDHENKSKEMCMNIEQSNAKMCNELKKIVKETSVKTKMSYAQTVAGNTVMPDLSKNVPLIIKPKEKQSIEKTKAELNEKVNPVNFKITNVENRRNGTLVIQSVDTEEREKIKEAIEKEISEDYEIKVPKQTEMQILITDMNFKINEKELIEKLKKQNEILKTSEMEIIKTYETKRYNRTIYNAKIKIDNESYPKVISSMKLNIGWDRCRVFDGTNVMQCYKCQGYNHKAAECKNDEVCYKCHGKHRSKECNKEIINKCVNCIRENTRLNLGLDENHSTYNRECPVYQNKLSMKKKRIGLTV